MTKFEELQQAITAAKTRFKHQENSLGKFRSEFLDQMMRFFEVNKDTFKLEPSNTLDSRGQVARGGSPFPFNNGAYHAMLSFTLGDLHIKTGLSFKYHPKDDTWEVIRKNHQSTFNASGIAEFMERLHSDIIKEFESCSVMPSIIEL